MKLSFKIMLYNFFIRPFVAFVLKPVNIARFGITTDQATTLQGVHDDFIIKFDAYANPSTHDPDTIAEVNISYLDCVKISESIKKQISSNTTVTLIPEERRLLDIPVPAPRRNHVKVPDIEPAVVCVSKSYLSMGFIALNPEAPFKKGKPKDVASVGIKMAVVAAGAPAPNPKDYVIQNPEKNIEFEMIFTADQLGKTVYIICYYLNNRGEAGKDGMPFSATII